jgi:OmcA/MtrC family decaheme c-type cytochrome
MQSRSAVNLVVVIGAALALSACVPAVKVGDEFTAPVVAAGVYAITITGASVVPVTSGNVPTNNVVVLYKVTADGSPASLNQLTTAGVVPTWTVAALSKDPVSGLDAWKSLLRTGSQSLTGNPIAGPGTPPANLDTGKQPGSERTGTFEDLGGGDFKYTFLNGLTASGQFAYDPAETMRVGCFLNGAPVSDQSTATFDFVPAGGAPKARDTVLDANCNGCHGRLVAHGVRHGVRLCLTCHTVQNADPDTIDPAAMAFMPAPGTNTIVATNTANSPNPLDLGRLVHRIHRGKNLPTLYVASNNTLPAPPLNANSIMPLPFLPGRNLPLLGRRYSIVGFRSTELVVGKVVSRTDNDQPARTVAEGIGFPRDLRDCAACHGNAPQADQQATAISRRTCGSCHADVWYGPGNTDVVHFAHLGGPQADDTRCAACHLSTGSPVLPEKLYADTRDVHVPIHLSSRYVKPQINVVQVGNLIPGGQPTVVFRASDVNGDIVPLNSNALAGASPVPRGLTGVTIVISGPASDAVSKNFAVVNALPAAEPVPLTLVADSSGQYSYLFGNVLPADATGSWAVGIEGSRRQTVAAAVHYDPVTDSFPWPYTGERVRETAENSVQYIDTATSSLWTGSPVPRRQVVALDRCNQCHGRLEAHGARHQPEYCVLCHAADRTDWSRRPKRSDKNVNLAIPYVNAGGNTILGTYDNREERSVHFKGLIHRIHTGESAGVVGLQAAAPFLVYGSPTFIDDVRFPNALSNCLLCHVDGSHLIESVPATAPRTVANETATIVHSATALHPSSEGGIGPIQSACMTCHDTGPGRSHAASHTIGGVEGCATCHGGSSGSLSVPGAHGLVP